MIQKESFSNSIGLKHFALYFFGLQKTVPQDRYVEVPEEKKEVPEHVKTWLQIYMEAEMRKRRLQ